jgi:hypothetical protein
LTWKYLRAKYETEGKWLSNRVSMLERSPAVWDESASATSIGEERPRRARKFSVQNIACRQLSEVPKMSDLSFDKALMIKKPTISSSVYSDLVLKKLRDASLREISHLPTPLDRSKTPEMHHRKLHHRPPPNFFVKAKEAVRQKYKHRRKITSAVPSV